MASYKIYGGTVANPTTLLTTVSAGTELYTHTSLTNSLLYYYRISAVDNTGNESGKTSDVTSLPHNTSAISSVDFTGNSDYGLIDENMTILNASAISFNFWVKSSFSNDEQYFVDWADSKTDNGWQERYSILWNQDGDLIFVAGGNSSPGFSLSYSYDMSTHANEWIMITGVAAGSEQTVKLYINGSLLATDSNSWPNGTTINLTSGGDKAIASRPGTLGSQAQTSDFIMDELGFWEDALSSNEIAALYTASSTLDATVNSGDYSSAANLKG
ncbi:uncharacterized protein METZ01_LOCUS420956, partial [marine metagenome]